MWLRHWGLESDPFAEGRSAYVPTPVHAEAVARLVFAIESGLRETALEAPAGLGKSTVLARALAEARSPARRIARAVGAPDGASLFASLAAGLGRPAPEGADRASAWRRLVEAARLCRFQGLAVVLALDECQLLADPADRLDRERLAHLDPHPEARVTVLRVGRSLGDDDPASLRGLSIRLAPLTRGEADSYLAAKLAAAGRNGPTFTPRAVTQLHALAGGVPRGLDRLATASLIAGAVRGLEVVTPETIPAAHALV